VKEIKYILLGSRALKTTKDRSRIISLLLNKKDTIDQKLSLETKILPATQTGLFLTTIKMTIETLKETTYTEIVGLLVTLMPSWIWPWLSSKAKKMGIPEVTTLFTMTLFLFS